MLLLFDYGRATNSVPSSKTNTIMIVHCGGQVIFSGRHGVVIMTKVTARASVLLIVLRLS